MGLVDLAQQREPLKLITTEFTVEDTGHIRNEPIVHLFTRRPDGSRRHLEVEGFYPYFYISGEEFADYYNEILNEGRIRHVEAPQTVLDEINDRNLKFMDSVVPTDDPVNTLHGDELVKIVVGIPDNISGGSRTKTGLKDFFDRTWEADVYYTDQFLIDLDIRLGLTAPVGEDRVHVDELEPLDAESVPDVVPRTITLDIEVYTEGEFPEPTEAEWPVISIVAHDNYDDEYIGWVLEHDGWDEEIDAEWFEAQYDERWPGTEIRVFEEEAHLLDNFHDYVSARRPDMMTGWNAGKNEKSNGFDFPYLINRSRTVNAWNIENWTPIDVGDIYVTRTGTANCQGIELFDMMAGYMKTQYHELRSYALGFVADKELGYGKEDIEDISGAWQNDPETFLRYNIRDVEAVIEIEAKKSILDLFDHLRAVTGASYDACVSGNIGMIDMLFLRKAGQEGLALPTSEKPDRDWYHGAMVVNPAPGRHDNVAYPDLASLYPNTILALNISPETFVGDEEALEASEYSEEDCFMSYIDTRSDEVKKSSDPEYTPIYYLKPDVKRGFISDAVNDLIDLKYEYKGTPKYGAVKQVTNCFTPDTDVMTPTGIQNIRDLQVGDEVYSLNPETNAVELKPVTRVFEYPDYDEELVTVTSTQHDFSVTPNHQMLVEKDPLSEDSEYHFVAAGELDERYLQRFPSNWSNDISSTLGDEIDLTEWVDEGYTVCATYSVHGHAFRSSLPEQCVPVRRNSHTGFFFQPEDYRTYRDELREASDELFVQYEKGGTLRPFTHATEDVAELIGWYVAEGNTYINPDGHYSVKIAQQDATGRGMVEELFGRLGIEVSVDDEAFSFGSQFYGRLLADLCGQGSHNKRLPEIVFQMPLGCKETLLNTLLAGDGHNEIYYTSSRQLAEDVARICVELGVAPNIQQRDGCYEVNCRGTDNGIVREKNLGSETASEGVYCVEVTDNHTLMAGRNDRFQFIGQSVYGVVGDSNTFNRGFRLYDWRLAETVTLTGRKVLQHTADTMESYLQENGYPDATLVGGDTDSAMISVPSLEADEEGLETGDHPFFDAARYTNLSYEEFMNTEFNISPEYEHYMEVEVESFARSLFFLRDFKSDDSSDGIKKKYAQLITWDEDGGVIENPSPAIKGFQAIRSDTATITAWSQERVLELILRSETPKDDVYDFLETLLDHLGNGDLEALSAMHGSVLTLEDVGIPKGISAELDRYGREKLDDDSYGEHVRTPSPHIRGAKWANQHLGDDIGAGSKPLLYYVHEGRIGGDLPNQYETEESLEDGKLVDAIAVSDYRLFPSEARIDWPEMSDKLVRNPIEDIVGTMSWRWQDITSEGRQSGLDAWA